MRASICFLILAACSENLTPASPPHSPTAIDCLPNLDGRIELDELPLPSEARAPYWISRPAAIDVAGIGSATARRWDWSAVATSDELVEVEATAVTGAWFAPMFPRGQLVAPLDLEHTVVGVLAREPQALTLLGIASTTEHPPEGQTLVVYDTPVPLYEFPIELGKQWSVTGTISHGHGTIDGLPFIGTNRYDVTVDALGRLDLPEVTFTQVHRLSTVATVQPSSGPSVTRRSASFLFECAGEVARATAWEGESDPNFRAAQEVRRLALP